jgi:hypothetical protein
MMTRRQWMRDSTVVILARGDAAAGCEGGDKPLRHGWAPRDTGRRRASQPQKPSAKGDFHFCRK